MTKLYYLTVVILVLRICSYLSDNVNCHISAGLRVLIVCSLFQLIFPIRSFPFPSVWPRPSTLWLVTRTRMSGLFSTPTNLRPPQSSTTRMASPLETSVWVPFAHSLLKAIVSMANVWTSIVSRQMSRHISIVWTTHVWMFIVSTTNFWTSIVWKQNVLWTGLVVIRSAHLQATTFCKEGTFKNTEYYFLTNLWHYWFPIQTFLLNGVLDNPMTWL